MPYAARNTPLGNPLRLDISQVLIVGFWSTTYLPTRNP